MAFLKRKNEYEKAYNSLNEAELSSSKIMFIEMDNSNIEVNLARNLINGIPLVINFEKVNDISEANKILAFLSGVVFVLEGSVEYIKDSIYLFAGKNELLDGSLSSFIEEIR